MNRRALAVSIAALLVAGVETLVCWKALERVDAAHRGEAEMRRYAARTARLNRSIFLEIRERSGETSTLAGLLRAPRR